jgi:radical SAM superfamily enzyme YgiQ (UPF0313 family)
MPDIVLTTLNAKYAHAAFGLRYLLANLGELRERAAIVEFDISQRPIDVVEAILARDPVIVGVGVYIWNVEQATRVVADLKRVRRDVIVIIGGPEVSHETEQQEIAAHADYVVTGEADIAFADLCRELIQGRKPPSKVIAAELPEFAKTDAGRREGTEARPGGKNAAMKSADARKRLEQRPARLALRASVPDASVPDAFMPPSRPLELPYSLYTDEDLAHRVVYVEASRGCPFKCEFCLSSLDVPVRNAPLDQFLPAMQSLMDRGLRRFKFVDRTFNLNLNFSRAILEFFLQRYEPGLFLHFEMIPDRLPEALRDPIRQFPPGALQFEVGIQSFDEEVCARISRKQDAKKLEENLGYLRDETGVHVHADLIVGLPGEDLETFGRGFDRLVALRPQEIQVGILKRLRGTPIVRHDSQWGMTYSPHAPYEVLRTNHMDFPTLQRMRRFARFWDLVANSGNFVESAPLIWRGSSPFISFLQLTDWLHHKAGRNHAIALPRLTEMVFQFLAEVRGQDPREVAPRLWRDYRQDGKRDGPEFLRPFVTERELREGRREVARITGAERQSRHLRAVQKTE